MNAFSARYKIPVLMALVVAAILIVFKVTPHWLNAVWVFGGALLGVFLVDFEYLLYAYIVEPSSEKAAQIRGYVSSGNFGGLLWYINENEYTFGELSIRSILFQILLVLFAFYAISANVFILAQAMVLTMMANLIYVQLIEYSRTGTLQRWFWIYNGTLSDSSYKSYILGMGLLLLFQFWVLL